MRKNERGIALIIVLFATLLLTVIGLGMMYSTNMETSINGNYRDSQIALYGALSGLQQGRQRIKYPYDSEFMPPMELPSLNSPNIIYIVSDASEVMPWDPANAYFDTELCQTKVLDLTGTTGIPCTETADGDDWYQVVDNAGSSTWSLPATLSWKWTRIQLKGNNSTPVAVNGNSSDAAQSCWNGTTQMSTPTGYTTGCQPVGGVNFISVGASGGGYSSAPVISFAGGGGTGAAATASMVEETTGAVDAITVTTGGAYTSAPTVTVSGNATATAVLSGSGTSTTIGGSVTGTTITAGGSGYVSAPTVAITGGGGTGATGTANLASSGAVAITGGTVTSTSITNGGSGYTAAPTVTFSGGGGAGATGVAVMVSDGTGGTITGGTITGATVTSGGSGYTSVPTVAFAGGGGGSGAAATAVLSTTGTTVTSGSVTSIAIGAGGSGYTSAPTVTLTGGGGTGAGATATLGNAGTVASLTLGSAGTQCYSAASDAVVTISGGAGTGAAASAVLEAGYSCVYSVSVTNMPQCTNKLDAAHGYSPIDQKAALTLTAGNQTFSGTLYVSSSNDKTPTSVTVQNPGYDTSGYNNSGVAFGTTFRLAAGAWTDCGNITATVTPGKRLASFTVTSAGSGYTSNPTVTVTGGVGSTSNPTATITRAFPVASLALSSNGSGFTSAPTVGFTGGGGSGATGTAGVTTASTTTYPVASINIVNPGSGYLTTPTITLSGGGGTGATGNVTATFTGDTTYMVQSITITGGGTGYTSAPSISFDSGVAAATAGITNTTLTTYAVESITINSAGSGYTSVPTITLSGGSGIDATATATVTYLTETTYPIASVTVNSGGSGYTANPTVSFSGGGGTGGGAATATFATTGIGTYKIDHIDVTAEGSGYTSNPTLSFTNPGGGSGAEATAQISGGTKYGKVWLVTSFAQTANGGRAMVQAEVASPVLGFASGGALTLDGPNPVMDAMPNSNNLYMRGNDANSCHDAVTQDDHPAIDGFDDPNANPPTASVEDIIDAIPSGRQDHYVGAGGVPAVQNGYAALGETMGTPAGLDGVMSSIYNTAGAHHYTTANVGTFSAAATTNSSINYVDADLTLNGNGTGRGILVVTRTLTMSGNFSWYGIIFVVGDGVLHMNGGGNGTVQGSLWVSKTWDNHTDKNLLSELGSPTFSWNGGGGNGVQYDHCYVENLMTAVPINDLHSTRPLKVLSYRALAY